MVYRTYELIQCIRQVGVSYKTAYRWWKDDKLDAYQSHIGTIIVREQPDRPTGVALYARVSSADQKEDALRQMQRLRDYAAAKGYQVTVEVTEIASGVDDNRPKLNKLLRDPKIGVIVVEHKDRLTRFGWGYIEVLFETTGRRLETIFPSDTGDDLVDDFVAVITSMAARIYGRRNSKRRAACVKQAIEQCMDVPDENATRVQD